MKYLPLLEKRPRLLEGKGGGGGKIIEWWPKPLRAVLSKRPTIIMKETLVTALGLDPPEVPRFALPPGVSPENAVETIARSPWAKGLAEGMAERGGLRRDTPEWRTFVENLSHAVARGLVYGR